MTVQLTPQNEIDIETKQKIALLWLDRCLTHLDECNDEDCELYHSFLGFIGPRADREQIKAWKADARKAARKERSR